MKKIVIILADGAEETEFIAVGDVLRRLSFEVTVAGLAGLDVTGAHGFGLKAERLLAECAPEEFDAVFLPGGMGGALAMYESAAVLDFVRAMERGGKIVSAICAAPMVLAKAGLLEGKKFTMYPGLDEYLPAGYRYDSAMAVQDGRIVTGKGPGAVFAFAKVLAGALGAETDALYATMFVNA